MVQSYNDVYKKHALEIILVAPFDNKHIFNELFFQIPWLAVPFSDLETRVHIKNLFVEDGSSEPKIIILNEYSYVSQILSSTADYCEFIKQYPFNVSYLKFLLVSDSRDFLVTNDAKKVSFYEVEGKVVGLYLFHGTNKLTRKLKEVYNKLKEMGKPFEIVLVYLDFLNPTYYNEDNFNKEVGSMPWLALPFQDEKCREIYNLFSDPYNLTRDESMLIMFNTHGKMLNEYDIDVAELLRIYGADVYPFTWEMAAQVEMQQLNLKSLFDPWDQISLISKDGTMIPISTLRGKNIILLFSEDGGFKCIKWLSKTIQWYNEIKKKDDKFEVIYICCRYNFKGHKSFFKFISKMPWMSLPPTERRLAYFLYSKLEIFNSDYPALVAFGPDGQFRKRALIEYIMKRRWTGIYPLDSDDELTLKELSSDISSNLSDYKMQNL